MARAHSPRIQSGALWGDGAPLPVWPHSKGRTCVRGFSLVEVVLALGIISFALLALLGITTVGTTASRESRRDTESGQIFQQIVGQLRTKAFDKAQQEGGSSNPLLFPLPALNQPGTSTNFYLDNQNQYVAAKADATKEVTVSVDNAPILDGMNAPLDANTEGATGQPAAGALAFVKVEISPYSPNPATSIEKAVYYTEICPLQQ